MQMQAEYNEQSPPPHMLQIQEFGNLGLQQLLARKLSNDIISLKYDNNGDYLALGCKNGSVLLYNLREQQFTAKVDDIRDNSVTSLKWRPSNEGGSKILVTADAGGYITFHHIPSMKPLFTITESENSIHTLDFSNSAKHFATGGKDFHVRIYDQETKSVAMEFKPAGWNNVGHDNRIFAVKFIDESTLISGGWDSVVHLWDLRQKKSVRHFYGSNISGQSLDYDNGMILAGCYSAQKQIQLWDAKMMKKVEEIDWSGNIDDAEYIYTASFSKRDPTIFGAGSTGANSQVRLYKESETAHEHKLTARIEGLNQGCFSLDFANKDNQLAFSTPHHGLYIFSYQRKH